MTLKHRKGKDWEYLERDPLAVTKSFWPDANLDHITFDPELRRGDYSMNRQTGHDGTLLFTHQMMMEPLAALANRDSIFMRAFSGGDPDLLWAADDIRYTVGPMRHSIAYGKVTLKLDPARKYPGMTERIRIPVLFRPVNFRQIGPGETAPRIFRNVQARFPKAA